MVDRVERRFDLRPERLVGDTVYGAARLLKWLVDRKITPHVPVWDRSARSDGTFSRAEFAFDQERNVYICPGGADLTSTGNIDQGHIVYYKASKNDCSICSLKPKCTTSVARKVTRDVNEDVRDRVRALANTEAFRQSRRERKKVEMRFAHMKRILKLDRLRLRGLSGARDEVLLTATAQNLRRLAKLLRRAPPPLASACLTASSTCARPNACVHSAVSSSPRRRTASRRIDDPQKFDVGAKSCAELRDRADETSQMS
jgi:hypothetical protein